MRSIVTTPVQTDSRVLLLGAGGRLGRMLFAHWPQPRQLIGQSRQNINGFLKFDPLADSAALKSAAAQAQTVICLSGVTPAHAVATGDGMHLNTDLALAAIDAAPAETRVFVASSAAVYGAAYGPLCEDGPVAPLSAYGHAKRAMEEVALARGAGRICVLRIGNVAGADAILGGWRDGMALDQLPDGGTPRRSYIGPQTLARVIHTLCMAKDVPDIINIAAPGVIEMGALLDAAGLAWAPRAPQGPVIGEVALDTRRLEALYSFSEDECTAQGMVAQWNKGRAEG
ncbi:NAD-dependent epimerase/dehydratase family protein [Sulfitobacter sp. F26169L]|uniref:NAD-dependent epimerase/dehydratase family protein n=1 Tax=Sulfitobacter sp. F26169L TaxID=2996015 RepID=UPI002260B0E7|nr:NAD-dependent epimerase/dehydratase family protein [Sulfitobacter sp. F26169L]MCX7566010.1 NAD-dependent epimerase/dehydratase family protein [Sulfitobacter sp. F26169L]